MTLKLRVTAQKSLVKGQGKCLIEITAFIDFIVIVTKMVQLTTENII
jgi:hypothetical protein